MLVRWWSVIKYLLKLLNVFWSVPYSLVGGYHSFEGSCCSCHLLFYLAVVTAYSLKRWYSFTRINVIISQKTISYSQLWEPQMFLNTSTVILKFCCRSQNIIEAHISLGTVLQIDRPSYATNYWRRKDVFWSSYTAIYSIKYIKS
jgi:hypothetical protein